MLLNGYKIETFEVLRSHDITVLFLAMLLGSKKEIILCSLYSYVFGYSLM